ncbi:MAG TPA: response regulator [Blastocatellia bacterium]|nr:response regulator [Blastocatellia bacterium]
MQPPKNRILVVESHTDTQDLMLFFLEKGGYKVTPSGSCAEAYKLAQSELFDLYIIEGLLPDGNGFDLCRQLRAFNSTVPIVFHSALAYETDKQLAYALGAQDYIVKPADPYEIEARVAKLLNQDTVQRIPQTTLGIAASLRCEDGQNGPILQLNDEAAW